jgi:hypothetical protein
MYVYKGRLPNSTMGGEEYYKTYIISILKSVL